jgi:hypothetical protein
MEVARPAHLGWIDWLKRELAPSDDRKVRTVILVCASVLVVIISMALQVPELALSAYMVFFVSKQNKIITTITGFILVVGVTIAIGISLLLYTFTYGHPEFRIPAMAIVLFLGMYISRVFVIGPLGFAIGFATAVTQSVGELIPSAELLVRALLWVWVALVYAIGLTVVLNRLFLPKPSGPPSHLPKPTRLFVPDAFTNPAHVYFALKVTFAAMFCYILYSAIDWPGIQTAFITCIFISLESVGATIRKATLRIVGCLIGGLLALFSILFLIPHMETIASLVVLVAFVAAIAGWVATGTERIAYAGLQIAFAFFISVFQGYAPDTDLDNIRNRVVGILLGIIVTGLIFHYVWPERALDRLRQTLQQALQKLARLLVIPSPQTAVESAKPEAEALINEISKNLDEARQQAELANFEFEESPSRDLVSTRSRGTVLEPAEDIFVAATSLASDRAWGEWLQLPLAVQVAESELRNVAAKRIERAVRLTISKDGDDDFQAAFSKWNEATARLPEIQKNSRTGFVSRIVAEIERLG